MRATLLTTCVLAASVLLLSGQSVLCAQAMISYGHGVAKAAGAGAAAGAGVGGILSGLGNPLSKAAGRRRGSAAAGETRASRQAVVPQRRQPVSWDMGPQSFGSPAPVGLIGGVKATGAATDNWQPSLLAASENLAVLSVYWGKLRDDDIAAEEDAAQSPALTEASHEDAVVSTDTPQQQTAEKTVILRSARSTRSASTSRSTRGSAVPAAQIPDGIAVGASVEEVLQKLGKPQLSFRGVAGAGYNDQYIFELSDGSDLVIYVLDGVVSHVAVS